jgi:hypothetical protein
MPFVIIFIFALFIIGWLSYYTSASVYKSLKKNDNKYARLIQVLIALGMFIVLLGLIMFFILSNIHMER